MEEKVAIPIAIDIYQGGLHHRGLMALFPKTGCVRIHRASVEVGIRENGHGDDAVTARIEAIRKVIWPDIDEYLCDAEAIQFCGGDGIVGVLATREEEYQPKS